MASIGISQMLQRQDQGSPGDRAPVWVVKTDIKQGDALTMQNVKLEPWPKEQIPPGALSKLEEIEEKRARVNLFAGEPVIDKKLLSKDEIALSYSVPPGFRLITVEGNLVNSFGGLLHPNDRVDVLLIVQKSQQEFSRTGANTILQDIKVFAVNDVVRTSDDKANESIAAHTVTLLVTPKQGEILSLASSIGTIKLVMRSPSDSGTSDPHGISLNDLITPDKADRSSETMDHPPISPKSGLTAMLNEIVKPSAAAPKSPMKPEPVSQPSPQPAPPQESFSMQVVRGDQISETDFRRRMDDPTRWDNGSPSTAVGNGSSQNPPEAEPPMPGPASSNVIAPSKAVTPAGTEVKSSAAPAAAPSGPGHS